MGAGVETISRQRIRRDGLSPGLSQALIHRVKKRLVLFDRASEGSPKVVAVKGWNPLSGIIQALVRAETIEVHPIERIKIISRVQRIITQIIVHIAVELIGAPLADDGCLAAHREPVFGTGRIGDNLVLLDTVYSHRCANDRRIVNSKKADRICAIEHVGIRMNRHPVVAHGDAGGHDVTDSQGRNHRGLCDTRLHERQAHQIPAVERQVRDLLLIHNPAQGTARGLDQRCFCGHGNNLAWRSHFQNEVNPGFLPNLQCDTRS